METLVSGVLDHLWDSLARRFRPLIHEVERTARQSSPSAAAKRPVTQPFGPGLAHRLELDAEGGLPSRHRLGLVSRERLVGDPRSTGSQEGGLRSLSRVYLGLDLT